jgi:ubiquinone biosynthesis protein Coq4
MPKPWTMQFWSRRKYLSYLTTLKGAVGLLRDPYHTESVFDIEDGLRGIEATRQAVAFVASHPGAKQLIEERYLAPTPDVKALLQLPADSLGHRFARHITDHGFDPDYFRKIAVETDLDYVLMRMRQTHDLWHVLTGIGTDPVGELALKAFELAQTRRPMAGIVVAGGVLRYLFREPSRLGEVLAAIAHGYRLGSHAQPFLAQRWELAWERPLSAWREELGIGPLVVLPAPRRLQPGSVDGVAQEAALDLAVPNRQPAAAAKPKVARHLAVS